MFSYSTGGTSCEFGDFSVVHCLTGWLPETIPLQYVTILIITSLKFIEKNILVVLFS